MNISYNWLKEYVNFDLTPDEVAAALTSIGLETGDVEEVQSIKGGLEGLVIGEVLTCEPHPNSDHMHITTVNLGQGDPVQIVCGAANVAAGQKVVVATLGTKLYDGDECFLANPTEATEKLWGELQKLQKKEREQGGVLDMETEVVSGLTAYPAGYINEDMKELEKVVGLQTDKPLKRAFMPYGGIKMAEQACTTYGYEPSKELHHIFTEYHKTHNQAVFDVYTPEMKKARHNKIITGLPDTYGRGRIVGDYRRVALYGIDFLVEQKKEDLANCGDGTMTDEVIRLREEISEQIRALGKMKEMAAIYGYDISGPAENAHEAVQWLYFGYLAAIKTQNGAAMSVGRVSTFLDIYIQRDLKNGTITEAEAQELIDHFVMKCRMVKFARIPSYNQLFSGDPVWATLEVGGLGMDGRSMVTKTDYRFLHTLENMGPSPEPNLTVLYSSHLPEHFKKYAAVISVRTSSIQYENDDVMRPVWGDDYSICCCVSATQTGKEMQFSVHVQTLQSVCCTP